jgi:hypothetical protein
MSKEKPAGGPGGQAPVANTLLELSHEILSSDPFPRSKTKKPARQNYARLVAEYKKAGYGISGLTEDGIVIVKPSGQPDSFALSDLDKALADVKLKR